MKKLTLTLTLLIGILIISCSSNDSNPELSIEELVVQNSPWTFDHYELIEIIYDGNLSLTTEIVENNRNLQTMGQTLTFNSDGTGASYSPYFNETSNWNWEIVNTNQLKLTFDPSDIFTIENFNVTSNQLSFTGEDEILVEALVNGKYIYQ